MKNPNRLMEQYEDALFELLLDQVAEQEGLELMAEAQRLNDDPSVQIPEDLDRRCLNMISRSNKRRSSKNAKRFVLKSIQRIAVAVFALIILMTVAYAAIPKFRIGVLNLLITVTDAYTGLSFGEKDPAASNDPSLDSPLVDRYSLPKIPGGYDLIHSQEAKSARSFLYANASNEKLSIEVIRGNMSSNYAVDTENAQVVCDIYINGYKGIYIEKDGYIHIAWADTDRMVFLGVIAEGLDKDETIQLAEQIKYID